MVVMLLGSSMYAYSLNYLMTYLNSRYVRRWGRVESAYYRACLILAALVREHMKLTYYRRCVSARLDLQFGRGLQLISRPAVTLVASLFGCTLCHIHLVTHKTLVSTPLIFTVFCGRATS